jgi:hypothetical protein
MLTPELTDAYCKLLESELIPATGCTEPIAIAYAAAVMRDTLGSLPGRMRVAVSGNIVKNAKSVVVPERAEKEESRRRRRPGSWPGCGPPSRGDRRRDAGAAGPAFGLPDETPITIECVEDA